MIEDPARARRSIRGALVALAALMLSLLVAAPAAATIVFERDGEIWRMNDSGSGQKLLVSQDEITDIDASFLGGPHVQANGDQVVFSATKRGGFGNDFDATGVYRWKAGALERLSPSPTPCSPRPCNSGDVEPEIGAGGRYFFGLESWQGSSVTTQIWSADLADYDPVARWNTWCDRDWDDAPLLGDPESPSPRPVDLDPGVDPDAVLYSGCEDPLGEPHYCAEDGFFTSVLVVDYGDDVAGEFICADDDTLLLDDPAWRPDGKAFAWASEGDGDPKPSAGIWVRELSGSGHGRQVLRLPRASWLNEPHPRYAGPNSLVFAYDHDRAVGDDAEPDIYRLDGVAACNPCTLDDATPLTTGGNSTAPAWTAMNVESPPPVDTGPPPVDTPPPADTSPPPVDTPPPSTTEPDDSAGDPADSAACAKAKKAVKKAKKAVKKAETKLEEQKAKKKLKKAKRKKKRACG